MKTPEILSTLEWPSTQSRPVDTVPSPRAPQVFDSCHVGVVLRAVLGVVAVLAVATLFHATFFLAWVLNLASLMAVCLPAVLAWLLAGCALKQPLARLSLAGQTGLGVGLGALAGVFSAWLALWLGLSSEPRWLASALAGALLASGLVAALVWRARAQTPASTQARLVELQSRIRPHFLFNTLNSAIALVRAEPARAEALLEDLSELFRSTLADSQTEVTLAQELQLAQRYLAIEQVRFGDRLRVTWEIDPLADSARLPPLILQPLVENAVRHGVEPCLHGADVTIRTERRGGSAVVRITNTAPVEAGVPGLGLAQNNVRERLGLMHDVRASFRAARIGGDYVVRLEVPA